MKIENIKELNQNEMLTINGGDEPAYGIGYFFGFAVGHAQPVGGPGGVQVIANIIAAFLLPIT